MKLHISKGNKKMGKIPSSSLRPIKDCINCKECSNKCYAIKAYRQYKRTKKAWDENSKLIRENESKWESGHIKWITKEKPKYFRFNVSGDIISRKHLRLMNRTCKACPSTRFLIFTKSFKFIKDPKTIAENLTVVLSVFPKMKVPERLKSLPRAYAYNTHLDYPDNLRRFKDAIECVGGCEFCGICWDINRLNKDVRFKMH